MPFGLMNGSITFQRMMHVNIRGPSFVGVDIGHLAIFFKSVQERVSHIREVFQRHTDRGLKITLAQCHFAQSKIPLLGHVTTTDGVGVDNLKILAIKISRTSTTPTELSFFWLGWILLAAY